MRSKNEPRRSPTRQLQLAVSKSLTSRLSFGTLRGNGQKNILLNLGDVSYIDSSGLGKLVSSYATAANQGAKVKLVISLPPYLPNRMRSPA